MKESDEVFNVSIKKTDWIKRYLKQETDVDEKFVSDFVSYIIDNEMIPFKLMSKYISLTKDYIDNAILKLNSLDEEAFKVTHDETYITYSGVFYLKEIIHDNSLRKFNDELTKLRHSIDYAKDELAAFLQFTDDWYEKVE